MSTDDRTGRRARLGLPRSTTDPALPMHDPEPRSDERVRAAIRDYDAVLAAHSPGESVYVLRRDGGSGAQFAVAIARPAEAEPLFRDSECRAWMTPWSGWSDAIGELDRVSPRWFEMQPAQGEPTLREDIVRRASRRSRDAGARWTLFFDAQASMEPGRSGSRRASDLTRAPVALTPEEAAMVQRWIIGESVRLHNEARLQITECARMLEMIARQMQPGREMFLHALESEASRLLTATKTYAESHGLMQTIEFQRRLRRSVEEEERRSRMRSRARSQHQPAEEATTPDSAERERHQRRAAENWYAITRDFADLRFDDHTNVMPTGSDDPLDYLGDLSPLRLSDEDREALSADTATLMASHGQEWIWANRGRLKVEWAAARHAFG